MRLETPDQIKARMKEKGVKQRTIANALGFDNPNKVSLMLSGQRTIKAHEMDIIRAVLADDEPALPADSKPVRRIPVVGKVPGGNWREAIQQPLGSMTVPEDTPPNAVGLRVEGDSMDRFAADGSEIIFDPDDRQFFADRLYVVINAEGETTFKQFKPDPARLVPCSTNPRHREIMIADGQFQIVGRVIAAYSRFS